MPKTLEHNQTSINIFVFAHNEQNHILTCLNSIKEALRETNVQAEGFILVNGSTDNTLKLAEQFSANNSHWQTVNIIVGDKSNAWNVAVHECMNNVGLGFFIDGDCTIENTSLLRMLDVHDDNQDYYAFAAIPKTKGRDFEFITQNTISKEGLSGNFYALSPLFLQQIVKEKFSLPVGLIGDDSVLSWVCKTGISPHYSLSSSSILPVHNAYYKYNRLVPNSLRNIKKYLTRLKRYSIRHMQQECIREYLGPERNFTKLPKQIEDVYPFLDKRFIRYNHPINTLFDAWAFYHLNKKG